jgi:cobyrinic acid a,c-diamide synthase
MTARAIIVAAPRSGSGKTTVAVGLIGALARRGMAVRAFKAGPDYIDAAFLAAASGTPAYNLDSWAMPSALLDAEIRQAAAVADMLVIEGVMGLFDGIPAPAGRSGSTADLAVQFDIPVLLVLDVSGQSQSAAAVVRGCVSHQSSLRIAGVVLNQVGSERHAQLARDAIASLGVPIVGALSREDTMQIPARHLGLVQASEHGDLSTLLARLAQASARHLDIDAILGMASHPRIPQLAATMPLRPPGQCIALAQDCAFSFVYPHLLEGWRRAGAQIIPFSPLADEPPPERCDCCWVPGGYPELHASALAAASRFRAGLARFAETRWVHGECGGYMVLGQGLQDGQGKHHAMAGLLGHSTSFSARKLHLGYREARLLCDGPIGRAGAVVRGHEFHYATLSGEGSDDPFAILNDGEGRPLGHAGSRRGFVTGSFFHFIAPA